MSLEEDINELLRQVPEEEQEEPLREFRDEGFAINRQPISEAEKERLIEAAMERLRDRLRGLLDT